MLSMFDKKVQAERVSNVQMATAMGSQRSVKQAVQRKEIHIPLQ